MRIPVTVLGMVPLHLSFPAGRLRSSGKTPLGAAHDSRISDTYSTALALPTRLSRSVLKFHFRFVLVSIFGALVLCPLAWCPASPAESAQTLAVCGSSIDLSFAGETAKVSRDDLLTWIKRAATAVCTYYGKYPVSNVALNVHTHGAPGVHNGVTYPSNGGGLITISVGPATTTRQLDRDWMLTHEMIHLAFPSMADNHHWIEEGISVYVEPIARVQAGQLSAADMWKDVVRDMPQGEPRPDDRGLDHTPTWGRTYWGGAMFCLVADVRIRKQTGNRKGLQDALRAILDAGGVITQDWDIQRALAVGDKATGTTVLTDLYRETRDKPAPVDLPALWNQLGIQSKGNGSIEFVPGAPLAKIREAITRTANPS